MKVAKFGGSSVAGAEQFKKVKAIVEADPERRVVVVSAAGKRNWHRPPGLVFPVDLCYTVAAGKTCVCEKRTWRIKK